MADTGEGAAAGSSPNPEPEDPGAAGPGPGKVGRKVKVHPKGLAKHHSIAEDVKDAIEHEVEVLSHFINDENNSTIKKRIRAFLDDARSSKEAMYFAIFMTTAIVCSVIVFCLSTVPTLQTTAKNEVFNYLEMFFNSIFTVELIVRIYAADSIGHIIADVYLYFDFAAIVPFWFEIFGVAESEIFTLVKALRMLRLLKLARQYQETIILVKAIRSSAYALGVPFFFLGVAVVLFATLVFYLERLEVMSNIISCDRPTICTGLDLTYGVDKQTCDGLCLPDGYELVFASIPEAIWFMVVTMTTVGYGDVSPTSTVGKIIASMGAVFGVLFLAMPLAIVGENFTSIWGDKEKVIFLEKLKENVFKGGITPKVVNAIFDEMDTDKSGSLSFSEFSVFLTRMGINLDRNEVRKLWATIDEDRSGMICCDEFNAVIFNDDEADKFAPEVDGSSHEAIKASKSGVYDQFVFEDEATSSSPRSPNGTITAGGAGGGPGTSKEGMVMILETLKSMERNMKIVAKRLEHIEAAQHAQRSRASSPTGEQAW